MSSTWRCAKDRCAMGCDDRLPAEGVCNVMGCCDDYMRLWYHNMFSSYSRDSCRPPDTETSSAPSLAWSAHTHTHTHTHTAHTHTSVVVLISWTQQCCWMDLKVNLSKYSTVIWEMRIQLDNFQKFSYFSGSAISWTHNCSDGFNFIKVLTWK